MVISDRFCRKTHLPLPIRLVSAVPLRCFSSFGSACHLHWSLIVDANVETFDDEICKFNMDLEYRLAPWQRQEASIYRNSKASRLVSSVFSKNQPKLIVKQYETIPSPELLKILRTPSTTLVSAKPTSPASKLPGPASRSALPLGRTLAVAAQTPRLWFLFVTGTGTAFCTRWAPSRSL